MKKTTLSLLSLLMTAFMLIGALASCVSRAPAETTGTESPSESEVGSTSKDPESESTENDPESETNKEVDDSLPKLTGTHAQLIENADYLKNNVTAYYTDGSRNEVVFENMEMSLNYALDSDSDQLVQALTNKNGVAYVNSTMDVFVRMTDGNTYFASSSNADALFNIHRFGYYYYQMRVEGQDFVGAIPTLSTLDVNIRRPSTTNDVDNFKYKGDTLIVNNAAGAKDPHIIFSDLSISADQYNVFEISIKADENASANTDLFFVAGSYTGLNSTQRIRFNIVTDNEWHTYRIPLYTGADYNGTLSTLRLDVSGGGATYEIKNAKMLEVNVENVPSDLSICRTFNVYSDKMHHVLQVAATSEASDIREVGMLTLLEANRVAKLTVKDKNGLHDTVDGVDWSTAEYVAFDIIDAGIFGYILPYDGKGGSIRVELEEGKYVIEQTMSPENGTIIPSRTTYNSEKNYYNWVEGGNTNDLFMGVRIYTDDSHDFDEFLNEAYCERNPLSSANIKIVESSSTQSTYEGYDSLRGIYRFTIGGANGFSAPYYTNPNKHYRSNFIIRGDKYTRQVYAMTYYSSGQLECAVLLDENDVMLPVSLEVGKNFSEQGGERNLYNLADPTYSETIFPLVIDANEKYEYTILNLYQNWGNYPLKQISWIQFFSPYYHLSTGVTETNCIVPWTFTNQIWYNTLPDFRGMSAPLWADQPQHTSCGDHQWLNYTDSVGNVVRAENVKNTIDSYGPTYADVKMDYITYDGKIKVSYTHTEMPQTDENRTYYEIKYEILDDLTIEDVVNNLELYKVSPNDAGTYKKVGYLNSNNESVVVAANEIADPVKYTLGSECPYFSFFDMDGHTDKNGYGNIGFLIYNSEFIIGGEKADPAFAIVNHTDTVYVTLDLETLILKAGDSITVNCILLPWGSQLLDDGEVNVEKGNFEYDMTLEDGTLYMDKNVRDVRENTLLNPLTAIAEKDCEVLESVFVPKVKTTNGESVEFTVTGGYNNVVARAYGFNKMTVPVIYEKINGEWVVYNVSSSESIKEPHKYDGYSIHYDGDGTFSYSFVFTMDGSSSRTFKVVADGNYSEWNKESQDDAANSRPDLLNIYTDAVEISNGTNIMIGSQFISKYEIAEDESYIRLYGYGQDAKYAEGYTTVYKPDAASKESGRYLAVKYRFSAFNKEKVSLFDFFISTTASGASNDCAIYVGNINNDGNWHTLIIDLEKVEKEAFKAHFVADSDGKYYPKFIRFDFFDRRMSEDSYIDIAFVGMDDSLANIAALSQDCNTVLLLEGKDTTEVDIATGEKIDLSIPSVLVDPSSGYTMAELEYGTQIDKINGVSIAVQGGSKTGIVSILHNKGTIADRTVTDCATVEGYNLVLGGWCVIEGGADRYVWSADGGKTWHNAESFGRSPGNAGSAMIDAAYARSNKSYQFTLGVDSINGTFQGAEGKNPTGLSLNLEDYSGQTVNIIFGVVPKQDTSTILPIFYITRVKVSE